MPAASAAAPAAAAPAEEAAVEVRNLPIPIKKACSLIKLKRAGETEGEDYLQFETSVLRCRSEAQDYP
jgi:hypothetical protein